MKNRRRSEWLKKYFSFVMLPIQAGPLKGKKWILTSGNNFWLGRYETQKTAAIEPLIRENDVVFDVGAHIGYYTVLFSSKVGPTGKVFAFEPRQINLFLLKKHLRTNRCHNVEILETCLGDEIGQVNFNTNIGTGTGHVSPRGNVSVPMTTMDELVFNGTLPKPDLTKIDVEGSEMRVFQGAVKVIETCRPRIVIATHSDTLDAQCRAFLTGYGYQLTDIQQPKGDKEMIALPPG